MSIDMLAISEKIRDHLTEQARQSKENELCRYRGDGNTSCAVGCLIPDERYCTELEGVAGSAGPVMCAILGDEGFSQLRRDTLMLRKFACLLGLWQQYHDYDGYADWCIGSTGAVSPAQMHQTFVDNDFKI